ncbi:MAG TPA: HAMP domain-containing histidine kinase [Caldithrix abyssi]|uniref:histidine kinase n=1 Tax=Caldithrix abyssi TaxID=187145 RepID=A0A7V4U2L6_CALAY|nr:HAMP domain-containing histidine kinase [Caldithrix abyssi]
MTGKPINILCVDRGNQIIPLVEGIFRSIAHEIQLLTDAEEIRRQVSVAQYDLLIVHNDDAIHFNRDLLHEIRLFRPNLAVILISGQPKENSEWTGESSVYLVDEQKMVNALPLVLGDFYSRFGEQNNGSLVQQNLIYNSLLAVNRGIIILNAKGQVQLLNFMAEKLLDVPSEAELNISFYDFINDGEKIWRYFTEQCPARTERIENYPVVVRDFNNREISRTADITCVDVENLYYLLQIEPSPCASEHTGQESGFDLISKFAESVANELLNPVNIISGRLQLMRGEVEGQEKLIKSLTAIEKQTERIKETMGKLVTFAHLKEDTVPQDVDVNSLLNKILLEPSIARLRETNGVLLKYELGDIPIVSGSAADFDLLFKTLLEMCFNCVGTNGEILVQTGKRKNYLNKNWAEINFVLNYSSSTFGNESTLQALFGKQDDPVRLKSVESTIVQHYIHHYKGKYSILSLSPNREKLTLLFPAKIL